MSDARSDASPSSSPTEGNHGVPRNLVENTREKSDIVREVASRRYHVDIDHIKTTITKSHRIERVNDARRRSARWSMPPHMVLEELVVGGVERGQLHAGAGVAVSSGTSAVPTDLRRHVLPRRASRRSLLYALAATGIYWPERMYL